LYGARIFFRVLFPELWKIKIIWVTSIKKDEKTLMSVYFQEIMHPWQNIWKWRKIGFII